MKDYEDSPTTLPDTIQNLLLFSRVTLEVKVIKLEPQGSSLDGLPFRAAGVVDSSVHQPRMITVYEDLTSQLLLNGCYRMSYMTLNKFGGKNVLKSSERTKVTTLPDIIKSMEPITDVVSNGKVTAIVMSSLESKYKCPHCHVEIEADGMVAMCENCDVSLSSLDFTSLVQFNLEDGAKVTHTFMHDHSLLEELLSIPLTSKVFFIKQFMNMNVNINYEKSSRLVTKITKVAT